ncbi:MAG: site-specific integrase [Candidatus Methanomethylophilaceae archaeon]|nr:site-specific integrase [Candidatus Methanomethylophilaceae archaeon]
MPTLKESHIEMVISRSAEILPSDFRRIRAYALVSLYLGAGLRTIEMCHAKLSNLDLTEGGSTIYLDHVKGNDSYGEPRIVVIIPDFVPAIKRYLYARSNLLQKEEVNTDALFFSLDNYAPLSDKTVRQIRMIVESDLSVKFDGRECRRTYGQYLKDCGVSIENVSINMGHTSTKTTERYYARQRNDRAVSETFATLRCMK